MYLIVYDEFMINHDQLYICFEDKKLNMI